MLLLFGSLRRARQSLARPQRVPRPDRQGHDGAAVFDVKQLAAIRIGKKIGPIPSEVKQAGVVSTWL